MSTRKVLPDRLHVAYDWTESAGEISELRGLTGDALREYATESAGNAGEHDVHDVFADDIVDLAEWLRKSL